MLEEEDREYIKEVSANIAARVSKEVITEVIQWHISSCPHGKTILASKWMIIGLCSACTIGSGGISALIISLLTHGS